MLHYCTTATKMALKDCTDNSLTYDPVVCTASRLDIREVCFTLDTCREISQDGSTVAVHVLTDEEYRTDSLRKMKSKCTSEEDDGDNLPYGSYNDFRAPGFYRKLEARVLQSLPVGVHANKIGFSTPDIPKYKIVVPRFMKSKRDVAVDTADTNKCTDLTVDIIYETIAVTNGGRLILGNATIAPVCANGPRHATRVSTDL
jgi:hypothetical protein